MVSFLYLLSLAECPNLRPQVETEAMKEKTLDQLGRTKRAIMETLWELGEGTVRQIRIRIDPQEEMAYTTILSSMQKLEQAGWLRHCRKGKATVYYYQPTQDELAARLASLRSFLRRTFKDDRMLLFKACLAALDLNAKDLQQLKHMLHEREKRRPTRIEARRLSREEELPDG